MTALQEQACFVMRFERGDIPKRMLSLSLGVAILVHFGAANRSNLMWSSPILFLKLSVAFSGSPHLPRRVETTIARA